MSQEGEFSHNNASRWRNKYLDLIERHEQLIKSNDSKQDQMRRALMVVALLAEGQTNSIDKPLATLREAIKPDSSNPDLEKNVKALQAEMNRFEHKWQMQSEEILQTMQKAAKNLLQLPLPFAQKQHIKKVLNQSKNELEQWAGYSKQLKSWTQLIAELPLQTDSIDESAGPAVGFFSRLFQRPPQTPSQPTAVETEDSLDLNNDSDTEFKKISAGVTSTDTKAANSGSVSIEVTDTEGEQQRISYSAIEKDVSAMINRLLAQLVIPASYHDRLNALKVKLASKLDWYDLVPTLEEVANLVIDAVGNGQAEFEQFLQGLDNRLETIQDIVNSASKGQLARSDARDEFAGILEKKVNDIRSEVSNKNSLGALSNSISEHLGLILQAMQSYSSAENERETELTKQLEQMQSKLDEMENLAQVAQVALEEQRKKAMHDPLTGLPNRESYQQRLEQEVQRLDRYGGKLSLIVCDVDLFKRINDSYGHLAGDKVLTIIARSLQKKLRVSDFIARFGGEEFVILMPGTSAEDALIAAEKLRKTIELSPFNFKKEPVQITISFGISQFSKDESPEEVFARADKALYKAKELGRNQSQIG